MGKKKSANKLPPFVPILWNMLNSKAYKDLPASAGKALPYFLGKVKHDSQRYALNFRLSYPEALKYGFAPATFSKIICSLIGHGFIDPEDKGGLRGYGKGYNIFRLSRRWESYGTSQFKIIDWKSFLPKPRTKVTSKREIHNFKKGNKTTLKGVVISDSEVVGGVLP